MEYCIFLHLQTDVCNPKDNDQYIHRWLLSNSKTIVSQIICPYCHRSKETFDHDHFLTCNDSDERKEVRIQSFHQLLAQLQTPTSVISTLINGLKMAYREYNRMEPLYTREDIQRNNQHRDKLLSNTNSNQTTIHRHRMDKSRRQIHARNPRQRMEIPLRIKFPT